MQNLTQNEILWKFWQWTRRLDSSLGRNFHSLPGTHQGPRLLTIVPRLSWNYAKNDQHKSARIRNFTNQPKGSIFLRINGLSKLNKKILFRKIAGKTK